MMNKTTQNITHKKSPRNFGWLRWAVMVMMMAWMMPARAQIDDGMYYVKITAAGTNLSSGEVYMWRAITEKSSGQPYLSGWTATSYSDPDNYNPAYSFGPAHCTWIIRKVTVNENTYYTLVNLGTNQYVVWDTYNNGTARAVHLETRSSEPTQSSEKCFFKYESQDDKYYFHPDGCDATTRGLNYKGDFKSTDRLRVRDNNGRGLIQFYDGTTNRVEPAALLTAPSFSAVDSESKVTVTDNNALPIGYKIRYTISTNGSAPEDPTATSTVMTDGVLTVETDCIIKAVVERYGIVLTNVATSETLHPVLPPTPTPTVTCDNKLELSCAGLDDAHIYYTINGNDPDYTCTPYSSAITLNDGDVVKAVAYNPGETLHSLICTHNHHYTHTSVPEIVVTNANIVTITGPTTESMIYYTTKGVDPVIGASGVSSGLGSVVVNYDGNMMDIRAIAKDENLESSCVVGIVTMGQPIVNIQTDECTETSPRGNVIVIPLPTDGSTVWYAVTAGNDTPAPDSTVSPNLYTRYTGDVILDTLDGHSTFYTIHAYAKSSNGLFNSSIASVSHEMTTGGKPELTPPSGSSPVVGISGGVYGDVAICKAAGVSVQEIALASDGTAEYTIDPEASGDLVVTFKHGNWHESCSATYEIPEAPAAPTWSQECNNRLSLSTISPMATIHYILDGDEGDQVTLSSPTYFVGCLDAITPGTRVRAKAFEAFLSSTLMDYIYQPEHVEEPQFFVNGTTVTISGPTGSKVYYTQSVGTQAGVVPIDPDDPDDPDATPTLVNGPIDIAGNNIITVFKAIAIPEGHPEQASCVVRVVTREGYSINVASDLNKLKTYPSSYFFVLQDIDAGSYPTNTVNSFTGVLDGNYHTISNLRKPLFNTITSADEDNNAAVLNLMLKKVKISTDGNAGAIANTATGYTRIYNCGILPDAANGTTSSSIRGEVNVGGLVGELSGTARVINCFSYANITGGSCRGGIVGNNNVTTASQNVTDGVNTMIMNCMFYGNIEAGGTVIAPIYGGTKISNSGKNSIKGLNNYNYFRFNKDYVANNLITHYNCALGAQDRFLVRFEFFRNILNSNRELAMWYVSGSVDDAADEMGHWVLDKSLAPYPILKEPGKAYPSLINPDAAHAIPIDPDNEHRNEGRKLGELTVKITAASGWTNEPDGAGLKNASYATTGLTINITDKDEANYNFNYKKIQLPYYNEVGTNNYTGNKVVTGWKITGFTGGTAGSFTTGSDVVFDEQGNITSTPYNFVDRACTNKDLYGTDGSNRVFNQGAYYEVPDGVTAITIEPYWANCVYLSDAYYDVTYDGATSKPVTIMDKRPAEFNTTQTVYNTLQNAYTALQNAYTALNSPANPTVYDYAVVLVGNYHEYFGGSTSGHTEFLGNKDFPLTVMSADLDGDNEPDNTFFYQHTGRKKTPPMRFDFLNVADLGMAQKEDGETSNFQVGIFFPKGWFEITNTVLIHFGQFEYSDGTNKTIEAPLILQGGIYEQFVSARNADAQNITYLLIGGNVWFKNLANGCHTGGNLNTPKVPINISGGDYENFYLSGIYRPQWGGNGDSAECYIDGGRFGEMAGAGMQVIKGDVTWLINAADIKSFFGGGINNATGKSIEGNITTLISNSYVDEFCGGPKFGNMKPKKTVKTTATDCHFGDYFGAGYGGTAINRVGVEDNTMDVLDFEGWDGWVDKYYLRKYQEKQTTASNMGGPLTVNAISTSYEYEYLFFSGGATLKKVARFYINFATLSLASTNNVWSTLTGCTIGNFYGGGKFGYVKGDAVSILTDCTVTGDAFGSGFSAAKPTCEVMPLSHFRLMPSYDNDANAFNDEQVEDHGYPETVTYTWKHVSDVGTGYSEDGGHFILTTEDLDHLGAVSNNATLTINGNTVVKGDVYGGGALSSSNTEGGTCMVNINGGTYGDVENGTGGNIYGGGMGNAQNAVTEGTVELNIGNSSQSANNVVINGSVYGCNNANGSPKDNVTVHIYKTKHNSNNIVSNLTGGHAIKQVFGGGNQAHYTPTTTDKKTTVHIHDCDNTIEFLYGGGNAANVGTSDGVKSATDVIIDGGRIKWVFGGGNGAGDDNPGANIYDNVNVTFHAGDITYLFGGSNEKGHIGGSKNVSLLNDLSCSIENHIAELYGGNNKAEITGNAGTTLTMPCTSNPCAIDYVFGGSRQADISGNVELTIEGGEYNYVFGGNNIDGTITGNVTLNLYGGTIHQAAFGGNKGGGSITGNITVNVEDQNLDCPLEVHDVFGAGDQAVYTAPTGEGARDYNPMVYVNHLRTGKTITGNVYGGGNGDPEDNTQVKGSVTGNPKVIIGDLTAGHDTCRAAISGKVYGGGNAAKVVGTTTVLMQKANSTVARDIYGGGNLANVTGSSNVNVLGGTVSQDVYGGGALANVGTSDSDSTIVTISGGIIRNVYGGGLGQASPEVAALVNGKVKVKALGGTIANMFGCNNVKGAPQSTVQVMVNDTTTAQNLTIANVFGGGNLAAYSGTPDVDINIGTVTGRVFGGGNEAGVSGGDVTMSGGTVNGGLYGGCNTSGTITNNVSVHVTGGTIGTVNAVNGAVYGGGLGGDTKVKGNVTVTIDGGTLNNDVYGGSAMGLVNCNDAGTGATEGSKTDVILNSGTINGSLYGGGHGISNADAHVWGPVQVTVNGGSVSKSVYGCNNASGAPQSTVKVDIYDTDHPGSGYALGHVFGGGNQADYTTGIPTVKVHGCDNSIDYVYGGGNAAAVKGTDVTVYGGNSIAHVFGGCYGANVGTSGTDVKIYGGTIDTIYGGNNESGTIGGTIKVTVDKQPEHTDDSCAMHIKEVYGGGNKAPSNAGQITIAYTGYDPAERINYVYGGANRANVTGPIDLTIREGRIDNVFGGNNNSGSISNGITVNIEKDKTTPARVWEIGNVYGGGNLAATTVTPAVNILNGTVSGSVFGGGNEAGVGGGNVTMTGGTVMVGLYGGCNTSGVVDGDIVVNINGGTIGSYDKLNTEPYPTTDVFGGGYGASTSTSGDVRVNINGGTIYGDVYGGSALGEVNAKDGTDTTFVNINGGILETKTTTATTPGGQSYFIYHGGNVYGGGLGRKAVGPNSAIPAKVYGKVYVNIGSVTAWDPDKPGYTLTTAGNATIKGNIYGCNNTYGSPQDDVVVNVYQTAHTEGVDEVEDEGYALANVFGGGNEADFTATGKTTTVNIYSCDNTIQRTFGGSNAAASNSVTTMIQGGRIHEAYGGGNGEVQAANVNGSVTLAIHGGTIGQSFSGSNQNGVISETSTVTIDDEGCGGVEVEEHFCGGNYANWEGDINATIECTAGMHVKRLYGGCKQANVVAHGDQPGNVNLTVKGGTYEYIYGGSQGYINPEDATDTISADIDGSVKLNILGGTVTKAIFGGSHILGKIKGTVVVNVEDLDQGDACPLDLSEADVYGGGNQADYPGKGVTHEGAYNYPQVNIKNATVKNVFGGGLEAEVKGNPQIKIKKGSKIRGNVYGGGNMGEVIGDPKVIVNGKDDTPNPIE